MITAILQYRFRFCVFFENDDKNERTIYDNFSYVTPACQK